MKIKTTFADQDLVFINQILFLTTVIAVLICTLWRFVC